MARAFRKTRKSFIETGSIYTVISLWKRLLAESRTLVIDDISNWMNEDSWIPRDGTARDGRVCFEFTANQGQNMFIGKQFTLVRVLTGDSKSQEQTIRNEYKVRIRVSNK